MLIMRILPPTGTIQFYSNLMSLYISVDVKIPWNSMDYQSIIEKSIDVRKTIALRRAGRLVVQKDNCFHCIQLYTIGYNRFPWNVHDNCLIFLRLHHFQAIIPSGLGSCLYDLLNLYLGTCSTGMSNCGFQPPLSSPSRGYGQTRKREMIQRHP